MAWSSGTFSRVHDWTADEAAEIDMEAVRFDQEDDSFEAGINNCLTKDGQNSPTTDLPMGGNKHTGVGNAAARTSYASAADVQDQNVVFFVSAGSSNAYTGTLAPAITAYAEGQKFAFRANHTNTGAVTLALNGLSTLAIQTVDAAALTDGMLLAGGYYEVTFDENSSPDRFVLTSTPSAATGSFTGQLTGVSAGGTVAMTYHKIGRLVTLQCPAAGVVYASNSTAMTMTGIPAGITPAAARNVVCLVTDSGTVVHLARATINTNNTITFALGEPPSTAGFTASGNKGMVLGSSFSYLL